MINKRSLFFILISFSSLPLFSFQEAVDFQDTTGHTISYSRFNRGNEQDIFGLISGIFPGVIISKAGADPNRTHDMMVRGAGTLLGPQNPLIVIDGMVGAPMSLVDLNNIQSIRLLKGFEASRYGMQGGNGVLEMRTKGFTDEKLEIELNQAVYAESRIYRERVLDRPAFLNLGGNDLGVNTTWVDEITRTSVSNITNLSARGAINKFQYYAAANARLINGVLRETGFKQYNVIGKLKWSPTECLSLTYSGNATQKDAQKGYGEAFENAYEANPTQPVYHPSGQLYQGILGSYYNPVGFIDLAQRDFEQTSFSQSLEVTKQLNSSVLILNLHYLSDSTHLQESLNPLFLYNNGYYAYRNFSNIQFNARLSYDIQSQSTGKFRLNKSFGASYLSRQNDYSDRQVFRSGLSQSDDSDDFGLYSLDMSLSAIFQDVLSSEFYLRYEKSSTLGANKQGGLFPAFSMDLKLGSIFSSLKQFELNLSRATSGLTLYDEDYNSFEGNPLGLTGVNPDLTFEQSINSDLGISYTSPNGLLSVNLTRFGRKVTGIMGGGVSTGYLGGEPPLQLSNSADLKNSGWEMLVEFSKSWAGKAFNSRFTFTTLTTEWEAFPYDGISTNFVQNRNDQPLYFKVGEPYGAIYAYPSVIVNGQNVLLDTNDDGELNQDDRTTVGQALPQMWMGWRNEISLGKTKVSMMLEGVFGHFMVNSTNYLRGLNQIESQNVNILKDRYSFHNVSQPLSSQFSENANYLRVRYLAIDHEISLVGRPVQLYFVANNLLTVSDFKGNDPSPRLSDQLDVSFYFFNRQGVQRTTEWLPSRSFMLGIKMNL